MAKSDIALTSKHTLKMKEKKLIDSAISENFKTQFSFAEHIGVDRRDMTRKLNTVYTKMKWLNEFLDDLDLEIVLRKKDKDGHR